jgi:hypothetical protein
LQLGKSAANYKNPFSRTGSRVLFCFGYRSTKLTAFVQRGNLHSFLFCAVGFFAVNPIDSFIIIASILVPLLGGRKFLVWSYFGTLNFCKQI